MLNVLGRTKPEYSPGLRLDLAVLFTVTGRECMRRRKSGYTTPFTWTTGIIILRRPLGGHGTGPSATINAIGRHSMTMGMDNVDDDGHLVATQIALSAGGGASISTLV